MISSIGDLRPIGIGGDGTWLAELGEDGVSIAELPDLRHRQSHYVRRGDFECFSTGALGVDPSGPLVAVADDGGRDETEMALILDQGTPQVTLIDTGSGERVVIEVGEYVHTLVFDRWRDRLLTATYTDVGVWTRDGRPLARFAPYLDRYPQAVVVTPDAIVTTPAVPVSSVELWHPETFEPLGRVDGPDSARYGWLAAAPDGQTLLTSEYAEGGGYGIRVWDVMNLMSGPGRSRTRRASAG